MNKSTVRYAIERFALISAIVLLWFLIFSFGRLFERLNPSVLGGSHGVNVCSAAESCADKD